MRGPPPAPAACPARGATPPCRWPHRCSPAPASRWSSGSPPRASACSRAPTPGVPAGSWSRHWTGPAGSGSSARSSCGSPPTTCRRPTSRCSCRWSVRPDPRDGRERGRARGADGDGRAPARPRGRRRCRRGTSASRSTRRCSRPPRRARRAPGHGPPTSRAGSARTTSWRCPGPTPTSPRPRTPSTRTWSSWPWTTPRRPGSPGSPRPPVCCGHPAPRHPTRRPPASPPRWVPTRSSSRRPPRRMPR